MGKTTYIQTFTILLFLSWFVLLMNILHAQGLCDVKDIRLYEVKGKVVSEGPNGVEPIAKAKVKLWLIGKEDDDKMVKDILSDSNGFFEISNLEKGFYRLEISYDPGFVRFSTGLKILKKTKRSRKDKQLLIRLGVDTFKPCGGGEATLIDIKT
jgi:hypothetical protein